MVQKKRILLIENFAEDFLKARMGFALYLQNKGYEVSALVPSNKGKNFEFPPGFNVHWFHYSKHERGWKSWWSYIRRFQEVIHEVNPDLIHSFRFHPNLMVVLANLLNRRILVLHVTGLGILFTQGNFKYYFHRILALAIYFLMKIRAQEIIVQNEDNYRRLNFYGAGKAILTLIPGSGVNLQIYKSDHNLRQKVRTSMDIKPEEKVYIMVSRLIWEKGIRELVEAFSMMDHKLWIVGWPDEDNPQSVDSEFIAQWNGYRGIRFLGKRNDVSELLNAADVYIYPSYYGEGIPRGILEALAVGLPVITTNMPGCRETVNPTINGWQILPRSKESMLECIKEVEKSDLKEMGKESRKMAEKLFSEEVIFGQIEQQYKRWL